MFDRLLGTIFQSFASALLTIVSLGALYIATRLFYNVYLHPLSNYPGPKLAAATRLWHVNERLYGRWPYTAAKLHLIYGPVIRIAPDELIYTDGAAWNQIYGHHAGKSELPKDKAAYGNIGEGSIIKAPKDRHTVMRKVIAPSFSERALRDQEHIIRSYVDLLIERLTSLSEDGTKAVDMVKWLNFLTFDVMGDLVFGESFNCLEGSGYHPWVSLIAGTVHMGALLQATYRYPMLKPLLIFIAPKGLREKRQGHLEMSKAKAAHRKSQGWERPDLMSAFLNPDSGITEIEYLRSCTLFVVAGSETTATLLSGATYLLLTNPEKLQKVTAEVRDAFSSVDEIKYVSLSKLEYLLACLNESLRMYPPVSDSLPRNTGDNTEMICGKPVPPHTVVGVHHWATYRSADNFARPNEFIPERWLENNPEFASDNKSAMQPFGVGPRNCVGVNLAYFEMRLALALLIWHFDLELQPESRNWIDQRVFGLWEKKPLIVKLTRRKI